MDLKGIVNAVSRMFPSADLPGAIGKAEQALSGTPDSLEGAAATARKLGLNPQTVDEIYRKYGRSMQARAVCGLLGTTPEALKADADKILGGGGNSAPKPVPGASAPSKRFPRLK